MTLKPAISRPSISSDSRKMSLMDMEQSAIYVLSSIDHIRTERHSEPPSHLPSSSYSFPFETVISSPASRDYSCSPSSATISSRSNFGDFAHSEQEDDEIMTRDHRHDALVDFSHHRASYGGNGTTKLMTKQQMSHIVIPPHADKVAIQLSSSSPPSSNNDSIMQCNDNDNHNVGAIKEESDINDDGIAIHPETYVESQWRQTHGSSPPSYYGSSEYTSRQQRSCYPTIPASRRISQQQTPYYRHHAAVDGSKLQLNYYQYDLNAHHRHQSSSGPTEPSSSMPKSDHRQAFSNNVYSSHYQASASSYFREQYYLSTDSQQRSQHGSLHGDHGGVSSSWPSCVGGPQPSNDYYYDQSNYRYSTIPPSSSQDSAAFSSSRSTGEDHYRASHDHQSSWMAHVSSWMAHVYIRELSSSSEPYVSSRAYDGNFAMRRRGSDSFSHASDNDKIPICPKPVHDGISHNGEQSLSHRSADELLSMRQSTSSGGVFEGHKWNNTFPRPTRGSSTAKLKRKMPLSSMSAQGATFVNREGSVASSSLSSSQTFIKQDLIPRKYQRTIFKPEQLKALKEAFAVDPSPTTAEVNTLSQKLGLTEKIVRIWFQNRRARHATFHLEQKN